MIDNFDILLDSFSSAPQIISAYTEQIPIEAMDHKRSRETWTIREHIYHIAGVQEMLLHRMIKISKEAHPVIEPFFPQKQIDRDKLFPSVDAALMEYSNRRREQIDFIRNVTPAVLAREAQHQEYTQYSMPILVNHMLFHEYWHMYRIEELWLTKEEYFDK